MDAATLRKLDINKVLQKFFREKLYIRKNKEINKKEFPTMNTAFLKYIKESYEGECP